MAMPSPSAAASLQAAGLLAPQVGRHDRPAVGREIARRAEDHLPQRPQPPGHQPAVRHRAEADGHVDPFRQKIGIPVRQHQFGLDIRIPFDECGNDRREISGPEMHRPGHPQPPRDLAMPFLQLQPGEFEVGQRRAHPFRKHQPGVGGAGPAGRPLDQRRAQLLLQR